MDSFKQELVGEAVILPDNLDLSGGSAHCKSVGKQTRKAGEAMMN
jgi:hypothetical protein